MLHILAQLWRCLRQAALRLRPPAQKPFPSKTALTTLYIMLYDLSRHYVTTNCLVLFYTNIPKCLRPNCYDRQTMRDCLANKPASRSASTRLSSLYGKPLI